MNANDILASARKLILRCGWQRDELGSPFAGYAADGAIYSAAGFLEQGQIRDPRTGDDIDRWEAATDAFAALAHALHIGISRRAAAAAIAEWNALVPADRHDVLAAFDTAIASHSKGAAA